MSCSTISLCGEGLQGSVHYLTDGDKAIWLALSKVGKKKS